VVRELKGEENAFVAQKDSVTVEEMADRYDDLVYRPPSKPGANKKGSKTAGSSTSTTPQTSTYKRRRLVTDSHDEESDKSLRKKAKKAKKSKKSKKEQRRRDSSGFQKPQETM
jgi:hypothetical protein